MLYSLWQVTDGTGNITTTEATSHHNLLKVAKLVNTNCIYHNILHWGPSMQVERITVNHY